MLTDHTEEAVRNFSSGMNCAQAVFAAFTDVTGFDRDTAMRLASSFGGGMGRMREVCGTCSSMFMIAGLLYGLGDGFTHEEKAEHYRRIQDLAARFKAEHGTINCLELLKGLAVNKDPVPELRTEQYYKVRPCVKFVRTAARILDGYIAENPVPERDKGTEGYDI